MRIILFLLPITLFAAQPEILVFCQKSNSVYGEGIVKVEGLEGDQAKNSHIKLTYKNGNVEFVPKSSDCQVSIKKAN